MLKIIHSAVSAVALAACMSQGAPAPVREAFGLCETTPGGLGDDVVLDFNSREGQSGDVGMPIQSCGGDGPACISAPITLSAPPRLPQNAGDVVRWRVGQHRFELSMPSSTPGTYRMVVRSPPPPILRPRGRDTIYEFTYDAREGVTAMSIPGESARWTRCSGRLTFEDLGTLNVR